MNRFSTGARDTIAEMRAAAPKIHDYRDYSRGFLSLSDQTLQKGETLKGAYYLRSAEFYMFPDDSRKQSARCEFARLMREHFRVTDEACHSVPYDTWKLSSYRFTTPGSRGTIVLFGGFDSYIEELFPTQFYLLDAGFDAVAFEAPGQGSVLEEEHLTMRRTHSEASAQGIADQRDVV